VLALNISLISHHKLSDEVHQHRDLRHFLQFFYPKILNKFIGPIADRDLILYTLKNINPEKIKQFIDKERRKYFRPNKFRNSLLNFP